MDLEYQNQAVKEGFFGPTPSLPHLSGDPPDKYVRDFLRTSEIYFRITHEPEEKQRERKGLMDETTKMDFDAVRTAFDALPASQQKKLVQQWINAQITEAKNPIENRKPYRKRTELPDPTKSARDEVNISKKQTKLRLEPELLEKANKTAKDAGLPRNTVLETAIQAAIG